MLPGCASLELGLASIDEAVRAAMFKAGSAMLGHLMLLMSMALNARYVTLDAEGLLPQRASKTDARSDEDVAEKTSGAEVKSLRVDTAVSTPQPHYAPSPAAASSSVAQPIFSKSPPPPAPVARKLTKQEKKALRDRLIRERLERQRR